jgi:glutathione S-transferase
MGTLTIAIGNKSYSSWSLRGWLALKQTGAAFEEVLIGLDRPDSKRKMLERSPAGKVPSLSHDGIVVWDSLAILEYLAETFPQAKLWPEDRAARATARSVSAEMHSGFAALRRDMPMNLRAKYPGRGRTPGSLQDIDRVLAVWRECRKAYGQKGPFLFGAFTGADAMYAPVVTRFVTYDVKLDAASRDYVRAVMDHKPMVEWIQAASKETERLEADEYPALDY